MYDILELNEKLLSDLRQIAKELNVKRIESFKKKELIYKILDQQAMIASLVEYLEKNATAKVSVTGYADKGTGNARINSKLSEKRANNVAEALKAKGIAADRIAVDYKGDTVQPYNTPEENRVSICIAE